MGCRSDRSELYGSWWRTLILFSASCVLGIGTWPFIPQGAEPGKERPQSERQVMVETNIDNTWCVGRFRFTLLSPMALNGRSQSIYGVDLSTVVLSSESADTLWSGRLTRIRSLKPPVDARDAIIRDFQLEKGTHAVWYFANSASSRVRTLEAMKAVRDHALVVRFDAASGKELLAETLVKNVINAYVPSTEQGFCIGQGSITSEPGVNEQALATFVHPELQEFRLSFDTHTVREPATTHPLSDVADEKRDVEAAGGRLRVLRDEGRVVSDLAGREGRISVISAGEKPFVRFTWHFPGAGQGRSDQPEIMIKGIALTEHQSKLERIWETMLQSLRRVPLSSRR